VAIKCEQLGFTSIRALKMGLRGNEQAERTAAWASWASGIWSVGGVE
jgi:hypothetical protein